MAGNKTLLVASAMIYRSEGGQSCKRERKGRNRLQLEVSACDKGLVELVSKAWGTGLRAKGRGGVYECNPEYSGLPNPRLIWYTAAFGGRAIRIVNLYKAKGVLGSVREKKLLALEGALGYRIF